MGGVFGFFLLSFFSCTALALSLDPHFIACEPRNCGNGLNISYPFRLHNQPSYCGHPGFELLCKNRAPVLEMPSNEQYHIHNISYVHHHLLVVNDRAYSDVSCPWPTRNVTFERTPFSGSSQNVELFFYFGCSVVLPKRIGFYPVHSISCLGNATHLSYTSFADPQLLGPSNYENVCMSWAHQPVSMDEDVKVDVEISDYRLLLKKGFFMEWKADNCTKCVQSGGRCGFDKNTSSIICFCPDGPALETCGSNKGLPRKVKKALIGLGAAVGSCIATCLLFVYWFYYCKRKVKDVENVEEFLKNYGSLVPRRYLYSELKNITSSFKEKLGQGGYGSVFKGKLSDGRLVAVKVLDQSKGSGEEFINEVASIGRTYHINVVALLGFCSQDFKRALVYEFMANGSLEKFIYSEKNHHLGWQKLCEIALGIARGLEYLHRGCHTRILHFDIKPHNILLDEEFCPKISDFGLAKLCPSKESTISLLGARGTIGYIAPEVYCRNFGGVSSKSDVYSYGMMVLEMVGGRRNINAEAENTSEIYFPDWIYMRLDMRGDLGLQNIQAEAEEEIARKMIMVGLWCIQTDPRDRPSMGKVVEMLEGNVESLPVPPKPFLYSPARPNQGSSTASLS